MYMKLVYNPSTDKAEMLTNLICKMIWILWINRTEYLVPHNGQMKTPFFFFFFMLPKLEFNDEHFLQMLGVPMGWKSSGSICNLVVHELEKKILQSPRYRHTLYRYVNNMLVFWTGSLEHQKDCVPFINTLHRTLKFSYEASVQSIQSLHLVLGTDWKRQAPSISNAIQRRRNWTILAQIFMPHTTYLQWLPLR